MIPTEIQKVEIVDYKPSHVVIKNLPSGKTFKVNKRFFHKRVECGLYDVVNAEKLPAVI